MAKKPQSDDTVSRLPWLRQDEPSDNQSGIREFAGWIVAAALLAGTGAYWFAVRSSEPPYAQSGKAPEQVSNTAAELPVQTPVQTPTSAKPKPTVAPRQAPAKKIAQAAPVQGSGSSPAQKQRTTTAAGSTKQEVKTPAVASAGTPKQVAQSDKPKASAQPAQTASKTIQKVQAAAATAPAPKSKPTRAGPVLPVTESRSVKVATDAARPGPRTAFGARLVRLAAFRNLDDAKLVWRRVERAYPPMKAFSPSIIGNRDSTGQAFYQFEVGTASQADSEMLCQTMQSRKFDCAIVRMP